ncbi:hypothetical protein PM082_024402 [Marasmius tenuissimus]|nr:hypothetical protein PM082_024402 [Marasmius tenuissimus]
MRCTLPVGNQRINFLAARPPLRKDNVANGQLVDIILGAGYRQSSRERITPTPEPRGTFIFDRQIESGELDVPASNDDKRRNNAKISKVSSFIAISPALRLTCDIATHWERSYYALRFNYFESANKYLREDPDNPGILLWAMCSNFKEAGYLPYKEVPTFTPADLANSII